MHVDSANVDMPTQIVRSNMLQLEHMLVVEESSSTMSAQEKLRCPESIVLAELAANACEQRGNRGFLLGEASSAAKAHVADDFYPCSLHDR